MNAQEALNELRRMAIRYEEEVFGLRTGDVDVMTAVIQQLIDQSNAKPKTLEELGWEEWLSGKTINYYNGEYRIHFSEKHCIFETKYSIFTYEELIAIAEKMKELGMAEKEKI